MAVIKLTNLGGLEPSVLPRNLPVNGAQIALNLNPGTPEFRPLLNDVSIAVAQHINALTLHRFDRNPDGTLNTNEATGWKTFPGLTNIVPQQIDDDTSGKIYYTPADGSSLMRWQNASGVDRLAGVPKPTAAPTITSITDSYVFTQEVRDAELRAVLDQAVQMTMARTQPAWVGPDLPLPTGWVRTIDMLPTSDPRYDGVRNQVIRVFAVDPSTGVVINTFSPMPVAESGWVFDQTLGGSYFTAAGGQTLPAWAAPYTKFWIIGMRAFAEAYDLIEANLKADLLTLKMPGTQGATPLLTDAQATAIVARLFAHGDKDGQRVGAKVAELRTKIFDVADRFTAGGKTTLDAQTIAFYQRTDVLSSQTSAKDAFAQSIWGYVNRIGSATAAPYWSEL